MDPKISIIVPVYKVEAYLHKCIDSILAQTFTDFELILVDDGSPDSCGKICDDYSRVDNRIKVIHKKNGGVSSARNAGLDIVKGTYVGFVDSDDFINNRMYEELYTHALLFSSDIVVCNYVMVDQNQKDAIDKKPVIEEVNHYTNIEALYNLYHKKRTYVYLWNKLFKRTLFTNNKFLEGRLYQDEAIAHFLLFEANQVTHISTPLYYYIQRTGSAIHSKYSIKRFDKVYAHSERIDFFKKIGHTQLFNKALKVYLDFFIWNYFLANSELRNIKDDLNILKGTFNKHFIHLLNNPLISLKQKVTLVLFRINPSIYKLFLNMR